MEGGRKGGPPSGTSWGQDRIMGRKRTLGCLCQKGSEGQTGSREWDKRDSAELPLRIGDCSVSSGNRGVVRGSVPSVRCELIGVW